MLKYGLFIFVFALFLNHNAYAETHEEGLGHRGHAQAENSISDFAPLTAGCNEETAVLDNTIDCDRNRFTPDCAKISLSANPVITWTSFDFARHNVVVLKEGLDLDERAVGFDVSQESRENLPAEYSYNFETGEFLGRPNAELRNIDEPLVSLVNSGVGVYNIWCRYHFFAGMVMMLIVVE